MCRPSSLTSAAKSGGEGRFASFAKKGAVLAGLLAATVGVVGKSHPALFMSLPFPLSVILWSATGGEVPPYFSRDAWAEDEIKTWTRPGDVIVATAAKAGTHWMLYCSHQIRTRGSDDADELFDEINHATPWMDLVHAPGQTWAEQKAGYNETVLSDGTQYKDRWDHPRYPFRVFKSHYAPPIMPVKSNPQLKFLSMARDGLDVTNSLVPFFSDHNENFRRMWGGFPPDSTGDLKIDAEARMQEILPGGLLDHLYFGYVKDWWPLRNEPNVLFLHYNDAKRDLTGTVRKMAKFMEVELSRSELNTVVGRCEMAHMKKLSHMFQTKIPLNGDPSFDHEKEGIMKLGKVIRKGVVGGHKETFTEEQIDRFRKVEEEQFGSTSGMLEWARSGGAY
mmetsp:Transcript_9976/g.29538  ORF Transcript_9976/g.29538 Transcript_9976/m.29538 type:complete len:392 (-) Transcript_9976:308-1483(-)